MQFIDFEQWKKDLYDCLIAEIKSNDFIKKREERRVFAFLDVQPDLLSKSEIYSKFDKKLDKKYSIIWTITIKIKNNQKIVVREYFEHGYGILNKLIEMKNSEDIVYPFFKKIQTEVSKFIIKNNQDKVKESNNLNLKPNSIIKNELNTNNFIKEKDSRILDKINIVNQAKKETLIFLCKYLNIDKDIETRKNAELGKMEAFNGNFKNLSKIILAYWKGNNIQTPEDLKEKMNINNIENLDTDKELYYMLMFDNIDVPNEVINSSSISREKGLNKIADEKYEFKCSPIFSELPDSCTII